MGSYENEDRSEHSESGFYCEVCDCVVKDSLNYLDHINGKKHNRNLGISLKKFTDSTFEEVKEMLEFKKLERDEKALGYTLEDRSKENDEKYRKMKRDKKKRQKARKSGLDEREEDSEESDQGQSEAGEDQEEDSMAKLMGFSNFSTSKK